MVEIKLVRKGGPNAFQVALANGSGLEWVVLEYRQTERVSKAIELDGGAVCYEVTDDWANWREVPVEGE